MVLRREWNNEEIRTEFSDCESLFEMIQKVEKEASSSGHVVCEVWINEMRLSEADESRLSSCRSEDIFKLAVVTNPVSDVLNNTVKSILEYLPRLQKGAETVADQLRGQSGGFSTSVLLQVIEGSQWMVESLLRVGNLLNWRKSQELDRKWSHAEESLGETVKDLLKAFEKRDFVLLADLLEYELTAILQEWMGVIQSGVEIGNRSENPVGG